MRRIFALAALLGWTTFAFASDAPFEQGAEVMATDSVWSGVADEIRDLLNEGDLVAQASSQSSTRRTQTNQRSTNRQQRLQESAQRNNTRARQSAGPVRDNRLARAKQLASAGNYQEASKILFTLSRSPQYASESAQIKYILGLMLYEMKLNQASAFEFLGVVMQQSKINPKNRYLQLSLEKLTLAADSLNSDELLRYAVKQINEEEFPKASLDALYFRKGEVKMQEKDFVGAAREFARIRQGSVLYSRSLYNMGLALSEAGDLDRAQAVFESLAEANRGGGITDRNRVNALMGRARVLYQKKRFDAAVEAYREIPRDTDQWHDALFESSWAMLRDGRFRSALSNFHSLHSPFYEDHYQPESLFLRAIVYLYICRYDEMEKVINLFERAYRPVFTRVQSLLSGATDQMLYQELARYSDRYQALRRDRQGRRGFQIPFQVAREILKEADVRRTLAYLRALDGERKRLEAMPANWKMSEVGLYAKGIVETRLRKTQEVLAKRARRHLQGIHNELRDLFEQTGFLKFEMVSSKREVVRKEMVGKGLERQVDEQAARNFYIQNGYEYWPFKGEYWLDEIGNYHYVGIRACE